MVRSSDAYDSLPGWIVATDGSCINNKGGYAILVQAAHQVDEYLIRRGGIPALCTNTKAEVMALLQACKTINSLILHLPEDVDFTLLADSIFRLQFLHGVYTAVSNSHVAADLISHWQRVAHRVHPRHVKSHAGQRHNEIVDTQAKLAALSNNPQKVMSSRPEAAWQRRFRGAFRLNL